MYLGTLAPVSNRATWIEQLELIDEDTGTPFDISTATEITVEIRAQGDGSPYLSGTLAGGQVTRPMLGVMQWTFGVGQMRDIDAKTYELGITIVLADETTQLIIGHVPVLDGVVT